MTKSGFLKCECRACAGHIEFPAEAAGETIACPHCGQPAVLSGSTPAAGKSTRLPLILGLIALLVAAGVAGLVLLKKSGLKSTPAAAPEPALFSATNQSSASPATETSSTNNFAISNIKMEKTPGSSLVYVTGNLRNLSDRQRYGVKLELGLFDANDAPVGQAKDFNQSLEPRGNWHFKALVLNSKAVSARLNAVQEDQ